MGVLCPPIVLDTTLADLYAIDGGDPDEISIAIGVPGVDGAVSSSLPDNVKFTFQRPSYTKLDKDVWARILLGVFPQYHAFVAGPMSVSLFDIDKTWYETLRSFLWLGDSKPDHQVDAERVFDTLNPDQRPRVGFIHAPHKFKPTTPTRKPAKLVTNIPLDCMAQHTGTISPDIHYRLLSKRDLESARSSGVPLPSGELLTTSLTPSDVENDAIVEQESRRFIDAVRNRCLPFVLKFPQSLAGQGVYVLNTEEERQACLSALETEVPLMLRSLNAANAHLDPVSLILQDKLPGEATAHSIFITKSGNSIFIGCCEQLINKDGFWSGAAIDYRRQGQLEALYADTMKTTAEYVYSKGYYGPMGADIMKSGDEQFVIDLNVRVTGSYILGLLKCHFSKQRGMHLASLLSPVAFRGGRDGFEQKFASELSEGRLVIVGWCSGRGGPGGLFRYSVAAIVVGGEDKAALTATIQKVGTVRIAE